MAGITSVTMLLLSVEDFAVATLTVAELPEDDLLLYKENIPSCFEGREELLFEHFGK